MNTPLTSDFTSDLKSRGVIVKKCKQRLNFIFFVYIKYINQNTLFIFCVEIQLHCSAQNVARLEILRPVEIRLKICVFYKKKRLSIRNQNICQFLRNLKRSHSYFKQFLYRHDMRKLAQP